MAKTFSFEEAIQPAVPSKTYTFDAALKAEGVTGKLADVARSIHQQESSSGKNTKTSNAGARGPMQVVPSTFKEVADKDWDIDNPEHNARAGIRYVKQMFERGGGDPALAASGYYGGPGGLEKARKGIAVSDPRNPNAPNTLQYGQQVAARVPEGAVAQVLDKVTDAIIPSASAQGTPSGKTNSAPATFTFEEAMASAPGSSSAAPASPKRSMIDDLGRQLGLTVRAGVSGAAAIPTMMSDAVTGPINAGLDAVAGEGKGFRFQQAGQALTNVMNAVGIPKPENATERVVGEMAAGVAGAGGMVGVGKAIVNAGGALAKSVGNTLASGAGLQGVSGATGAGAASVTRESGGGAGAQLAAGLAGGLAPGMLPAAGAATLRGALRGGEAGRQRIAQNLATFEAAGVQPTMGQAAGGKLHRVEALIGKAPGGAGVIAAYADRQADDMATAVQRLTDELAPGANAMNAGEAISKGINAFKQGVKVTQQKLYANLDQHLPLDTSVLVPKTQEALKALNADIPGAPNISEFFKNAKIKGIDRALQADLQKATATGGDDLAAQASTLPYQAIKKLRTLVGNEISDSNLVSDVPRSKWQALYGALSDDLGVAATKAGPEAEASWKWANQYTKTQLDRLEQLSNIVAKDSPEKIFAAATAGTLEGDTIIKRVINAIPKQERREVAAAVLQRMGRATAGQQNAMGDAFSSETFLTNLSKLSPASRRTLFGRTDVKGIEDQIGKFANVAEMRREGGRVFANPSGTASTGAQLINASAIGSGITTSVMSGNPLPLAGALLPAAAANMGARVVTNPVLTQKLAKSTRLPPGAMASGLAATTRIGEGTEPEGLPSSKTFTFEEAMMSPEAAPGQSQELDPARIELNGMAPDRPQPVAEPAHEPDDVDVPVAPATLQSAAEIDPASAFTSATRPDGSLAIKGDSEALLETLQSAGIPAHGLMRTPEGLVVRRSHAENVRAAIDRMQAPASEVVTEAAAGPVEGQTSNAFSPTNNAAAVTASVAGGQGVDSVQSNAGAGIARPPDGVLGRASKAMAMAQSTPGAAGMQPAQERDIRNPKGDPFATLFSARLAAQRAGGGYAPVALEDGTFLVRKNAAGNVGASADVLADYGDARSGTSDQANTGAVEQEVQMAPTMSQIAAAGPADAQALETGQNFPPPQAEAQAQTLPSQVAEGSDASGAQSVGAGPGPDAVAPTGVTDNQNAVVARIQRVHTAGETEVAELMQRTHDRATRLGQAPTELDAMRSVAPDLAPTQLPEFDQTYMQLRGTGIKPAEAAARAGMLATIQEQGPTVGMPAQRLSELLGHLAKLPLVDAPGFAQQFAVSLVDKGEIAPFEGADQIGQLLEVARNSGMHAMAESVYA